MHLQVKVLRRRSTASDTDAETVDHPLAGEDDLAHLVPPLKHSHLATPRVFKLRAGFVEKVAFLVCDLNRGLEVVEGRLGGAGAMVAGLISLSVRSVVSFPMQDECPMFTYRRGRCGHREPDDCDENGQVLHFCLHFDRR